MGRAKRKTRLADYDFKMAENNLCKTRGKEKESFRVCFSEGKVHQLVQKDKIPCSHSSCEKDPHFFERNGISQHFRVVHKCTFTDVNLQQSLALRRRLHAKETMNILNEFFKSRSEKVRQICVLFIYISPYCVMNENLCYNVQKTQYLQNKGCMLRLFCHVSYVNMGRYQIFDIKM